LKLPFQAVQNGGFRQLETCCYFAPPIQSSLQ
jgi:hypothetical protein